MYGKAGDKYTYTYVPPTTIIPQWNDVRYLLGRACEGSIDSSFFHSIVDELVCHKALYGLVVKDAFNPLAEEEAAASPTSNVQLECV